MQNVAWESYQKQIRNNKIKENGKNNKIFTKQENKKEIIIKRSQIAIKNFFIHASKNAWEMQFQFPCVKKCVTWQEKQKAISNNNNNNKKRYKV